MTRISPVAFSDTPGNDQLKSKAHMKHGSDAGAGVVATTVVVVVIYFFNLFEYIYSIACVLIFVCNRFERLVYKNDYGNSTPYHGSSKRQ